MYHPAEKTADPSAPKVGCYEAFWENAQSSILTEANLTNVYLLHTGNMINTVSTASMPTVESRIEGVNVDLMAAPTSDASMPSQLDFGGLSQDSVDLMFQTMPYEVSEPVMCSSISLYPFMLHLTHSFAAPMDFTTSIAHLHAKCDDHR